MAREEFGNEKGYEKIKNSMWEKGKMAMSFKRNRDHCHIYGPGYLQTFSFDSLWALP